MTTAALKHEGDKGAGGWQLVFAAGGITLGVRCDEAMITAAAYLPARAAALPPQNMLAAECARQLKRYFKRGAHAFELPLAAARTAHQRRVRAVMQSIPPGQTMTYGGVAARLKNSSARAVGGACRANDMALLVPCHRVVAAGGIGGFMGDDGACELAIKRRLLRHEGAL